VKRAWQKLPSGHSAKGNRYYDWAGIDPSGPGPDHHELLIRRNRAAGELAYTAASHPGWCR
jgi:hypothetical protein